MKVTITYCDQSDRVHGKREAAYEGVNMTVEDVTVDLDLCDPCYELVSTFKQFIDGKAPSLADVLVVEPEPEPEKRKSRAKKVENTCPYCPDRKPSSSRSALGVHLRTQHGIGFKDLRALGQGI